MLVMEVTMCASFNFLVAYIFFFFFSDTIENTAEAKAKKAEAQITQHKK
jgi:hypothetical protein